jgi:LPXTG-site transpeptidase (sortase) family protein
MPTTIQAQRSNFKHYLIIGVVLVGVLAAALLIFKPHSNLIPSNFSDTNASAGLSKSQPTRIKIEKLGLDAQVVELGLNNDQTIEVPKSAQDVGWYKYGPTPGEVGPAVMVGHLDWYNNQLGSFYHLNKLQVGDTFQITRQDGSSPTFRVTKTQTISQDQFPTQEVYGNTSDAEVRLITCSGQWLSSQGHYSGNLIVFATLAK